MHAVLILIPVTVYCLLILVFALRGGLRNLPEAIVKAHLVVFAFIAVFTEALSAIGAISFPALLTAWLLFLLVCSVIAGLLIQKNRRDFALPVFRQPTLLTGILVGALVFILGATLATGFLYPPNTWDSMTYHMPRVVHWMSNASVSFYPTAEARQNYLAPLAEFAIMHLQILTGGDLYANFIQWVSFLVLLCLSYAVAAELGLSKWQQLVSAIVMATLPMGILQASSTQNDLVASSFVMAFGLFMLRAHRKLNNQNILFAATGLGLALLTKGTAFLYGAGIGVALGVPILIASRHTRAGLTKAVAALSFVVIMALSFNAGHFWRNVQLYGHPLSTETTVLRNEEMSPAAWMSNVIRNGGLHLGTPSSRIRGASDRAIHWLLGPRINDPKTTWAGASFGVLYSRHEDKAGNLIHMLVALVSLVVLPILWRRGHCTRAVYYAIGTMLGAVFYCWALKWQPWASRLHTPLFAMAAPLMAITITPGVYRARKHAGYLIVLLMVCYSLRFVVANNSRDLESLDWMEKDRKELYFENKKFLFRGYSDAVKWVQEAGAQDVGLYLGGDDWEYPFWALAQQTQKNQKPVTFKHVGVSNLSRTLNRDESLPAYVIATKKIEKWKHAAQYASVYHSDHVSVFKKSQ